MCSYARQWRVPALNSFLHHGNETNGSVARHNLNLPFLGARLDAGERLHVSQRNVIPLCDIVTMVI